MHMNEKFVNVIGTGHTRIHRRATCKKENEF